eukprot:GHVQ01037076.1.p1 GENE.GHVQ01037076.1~~GHVQ01037076.1.p1  ORF type:complete len:129 (-),score=8.80 GHVQ01037076.1:51-437(-)
MLDKSIWLFMLLSSRALVSEKGDYVRDPVKIQAAQIQAHTHRNAQPHADTIVSRILRHANLAVCVIDLSNAYIRWKGIYRGIANRHTLLNKLPLMITLVMCLMALWHMLACSWFLFVRVEGETGEGVS